MAINFDALTKDLNGITCQPNLPEGYYQGKFLDYKIIPAKPATATTKAKAEQLSLSFGIDYKGFHLIVAQNIANFRETLTIKDGPRKGETFQPIMTLLNPLREQMALPADAPLADLPTALKWAAANPVNLGYHKNANGYRELKVVYPQAVAADEAEVSLDNQIPMDI